MTQRMYERLYDRAARGLPVLGRPEDRAERAWGDAETPEEAADRLERQYVLWAGLTGFLCGLPGYASMPVTIPSNVAGVLLLQLHLCAALAAVAGRNPRDEPVRSWAVDVVRLAGRRESLDPDADPHPDEDSLPEEERNLVRRTASKLVERAVRFAGERTARWLGRAYRTRARARNLPLLGGVVGGFADGYHTRRIARRARRSVLEGGSHG